MIPPLPPGASPLDADEASQLIPRIATREELNEYEAANIQIAVRWASGRGRRTSVRDIATMDSLLALHRRMFNRTWRWAGQIRDTNKNIGASKELIRPRLRDLCDDVRFQVENGTYPPDELAVRFHHRLVSIHPFPNGNGRHSRLAADMLVERLGRPPFGWGRWSLTAPGPVRAEYLAALREADRGSMARLVAFAHS
jgi:Fic-DOC domain mobile mystery protein B